MEVIKIDPNAKQIILLEFPEHIPTMDVREMSRKFKEELEEWWNSGDPFAVIGLESGFKVRVERIDTSLP